jgi:hypothetical protein
MDSPIWGMTTSVGMNFFLPQNTDTGGQNQLVSSWMRHGAYLLDYTAVVRLLILAVR